MLLAMLLREHSVKIGHCWIPNQLQSQIHSRLPLTGRRSHWLQHGCTIFLNSLVSGNALSGPSAMWSANREIITTCSRFTSHFAERLGRHFQKRRRKNGSSRRFAMKAKQSAPVSDSQINVKRNPVDRTQLEIVVEACNSNIDRLSFSQKSERFLNAVRKFLQQCQHITSQIWIGFCGALSFWRVFDQRMEILHQKVEELQKELHLLRNNSLLHPEPRCSGCNCTTSMQHHQHSPVAQPTALLPSPPPPPPPLPPPSQVPQRLPLVPKCRTSHSALQAKADQRVAITLKDLQAVQLRKVTATNKILKSPYGKRAPLVTLVDLQKVSLRRVRCSLPSPKRLSPGRSPRKSPIKLHVNPQKLKISTPTNKPLCNKENVERSVRTLVQ
ncbi:proline-rich protein 11 isoform X2 [Silurus meridionalis]|uniref:proline-rich protein 11 isoform X2 n=1 Tax=Silurus meridionalis TaxID=175797 RepID=UPI001EEB917B|nr:proline-rich protein 11 isoform X2 [Silurus meridionalis]